MRFDILKAVKVTVLFFCVVTTRRLMGRNQGFRAIYCLMANMITTTPLKTNERTITRLELLSKPIR